MLSHLLISLLLLQAPVRPTEGGIITGIVKATDGKPAVGVRVTARPKPDSLNDLQDGIAMSSIAMTDQNGRYRLENVPPGRYYVAAGNIDVPTYYPGTLDVAMGTTLQIAPGAERSAVDFTLADISFSLAGTLLARPGYMISVQVQVEGGGKLPVSSPNGVALLEARPQGTNYGTTMLLNTGAISLPFPNTPVNYEMRVLNVPEGYAVKSMTYGSVDLLTGLLQLSAANIPLSNTQPGGVTFTLRSAVQLPQVTFTNGALSIMAPAQAATSPSTLSITLTPTPIPTLAGVRVTGQAGPGTRSVWLGDVPGFVYADGTFELRGVSPGPHLILAPNAGASIVVGDRDIDGIQLDALPVLPREYAPSTPTRHAPGTKIPLATLKGRLISAATQQPMQGIVNIVGWSTQVGYPVDRDGRFEIPKLLPGSYNLMSSIFDHYTVNETVVIGEEDSTVELRVRPAY